MIRYALKCAQAHKFESWFQSAEAYDTLAAAGHLSCAICGTSDVQKDIMAPKIAAKSAPDADAAPPDAPPPQLSISGSSAAERALAALRKHVEETSTDVGAAFADKARAMHLGDVPEQPIHGTAGPDEARSLLDDGVPILPLPFRPTNKNN